jgi:hypothetical protein
MEYQLPALRLNASLKERLSKVEPAFFADRIHAKGAAALGIPSLFKIKSRVCGKNPTKIPHKALKLRGMCLI